MQYFERGSPRHTAVWVFQSGQAVHTRREQQSLYDEHVLD